MNHYLKFIFTLAVGLTLSISSLAQKTTTIKEKNADPSFLKWIEVRKASEQVNNEELTAIVVYTCTRDERHNNESCEPLVDEVVTLNELRNTLKQENLKAGVFGVGALLFGAGVMVGAVVLVPSTTLAAGATGAVSLIGGATTMKKGGHNLTRNLTEGSRLRKLLSKKDVLFVRNIEQLEQNLEYLIKKIILKREEPRNYVR